MGHFVKGEFTYIQKKKKPTQNQSPGKKVPQECSTCLLLRAEPDICEASRFKIPYPTLDAGPWCCSLSLGISVFSNNFILET